MIIIGRSEAYIRRFTNAAGQDVPAPSFWTGSKFSYEFPDAEEYKTKTAALAEGARVRDLIERKLHRPDRFLLFIVSDYGLETEKEIPLQ